MAYATFTDADYLDPEAGLRDINGRQIKLGDWVLVPESNGAEWMAQVIFEDGMLTVQYFKAINVKNPPEWKMEHDYIKSRGWLCHVGKHEYIDTEYSSLASMAQSWKHEIGTRDDGTNYYKVNERGDWYDVHGFKGGRPIKVEIVDSLPPAEIFCSRNEENGCDGTGGGLLANEWINGKLKCTERCPVCKREIEAGIHY